MAKHSHVIYPGCIYSTILIFKAEWTFDVQNINVVLTRTLNAVFKAAFSVHHSFLGCVQLERSLPNSYRSASTRPPIHPLIISGRADPSHG